MLTCRRMIRQIKPDLVLTYTVKPNVYGSFACQMTKTPYINNVTGLGSVLQNDSFLARFVLCLQKKAYGRSSCVFFQNQANYRALLEKRVVAENTPYEILPGSGVNLALHSFAPIREEDGVTKFIIVSRIREDKGFNEFFDAAEIVKKKHENTEFHVVGWYEEDYYKDRVERLIKEGIIVYHGKQIQEEVHHLIVASDCVVLPSYHEGMANVLLEAAASGRPVVATNIPGCKETFEEGVTGFGCEVKNTESLVQALERFIGTSHEKRSEMGRLARRKMENEFDREFVAAKYIKRINDIVGDKTDETL